MAKPDPAFFAHNRGQSAFGDKQRDMLQGAQSQYHDLGVARELGYAVCWIERGQGLEGWAARRRPRS